MSAGKSTSKAVQEFLSEAQDFVESLSKNLMEIDDALRTGEPDPDMVNEVFRGWHTLKGLASTFGVEPLAKLAHEEENLLDDLRLGREVFTPTVLDSLLESVEEVMKILAVVRDSGDMTAAAYEKVRRRRASMAPAPRITNAPATASGARSEPRDVVDNEVLEVLTEFEEHRLTTNLRQGKALYRVRTRFSLLSIDEELEAIKARLKPLGEIITYLPSTESGDPDMLDIDVLLALHGAEEDLAEVLEGISAQLEVLVPAGALLGVTNAPSAATSSDAAPRDPSRRSTGAPGLVPGVGASLAPAEREAAMSLRSVSQSVRVDIGKLDKLMNVVGELNLIRGAVAKLSEELRAIAGRREIAIELHRVTRGFERRLAEMREGILEVRMVPVSQLFDRLARMTRKTSRNLGKEIHFVVSGADTEVDKLIIEELSDPLMHIIRNSIDHGIEDPQERRVAGKPDVGTVALTAYQKGNHILFEVEDDGAGIDTERILEAAVGRGYLPPDAADTLSERELLNLIFLPGVTTSSEATQVSGRGVGMDVVKTNIAALGGIVEVQSELGIGTKFTITMPVTLAIIPALLVSVDSLVLAVALNTVAEALTISQDDVRSVLGVETMTLRGQTLPLCRLDRFFGMTRPGPIPAGSRVLVAALGQRRLGLVVDALIGQQDVVIKPLGPTLDEARLFAGATDLGDQRLSLVLDTGAVIEGFFSSHEDVGAHAALME